MTELHQINVGAYGPEEGNNAYWLPAHRALIDPGPPGEPYWNNLLTGLKRVGATPTDVEHVFVTHWHVDHAGLAPRFADQAGALLYLHKDDAPFVREYGAARNRRLKRDKDTLRRWGVPGHRIEMVVEHDTPSPMPDTFPVIDVEHQDDINGIQALHTPGHTLGHTSYMVDGHAFVGDSVLPTYTPNYGGSDTRMQDPLATYRRSVQQLRGIARMAHPGHGNSLDLDTEIAELIAHWRSRAKTVMSILRESDPLTPWDIAEELFGEMAGVHVKLGTGEAAAQLMRLEALGVVEGRNDGKFQLQSGAEFKELWTLDGN